MAATQFHACTGNLEVDVFLIPSKSEGLRYSVTKFRKLHGEAGLTVIFLHPHKTEATSI